jgi:hypothetical protein
VTLSAKNIELPSVKAICLLLLNFNFLGLPNRQPKILCNSKNYNTDRNKIIITHAWETL